MPAAIVSDLHLGAGNDSDILRRREALEPLLGAIAGTDPLVLLGDVVELRDRPLPEAIELAAPVLNTLAEAAGGEIVLVPGNHDHRLVSGWLEQRAVAGRRPLRLADRARLDVWPASALRDAMPGASLRISYPGAWIRDDVYATHGHYLDRHLTVPTFERLGLAVVERTLGLPPADARPARRAGPRAEPDSPDDYERIAAPIYAFLFALAQAGTLSGHPGGSPSQRIWDALSGGESAAGTVSGAGCSARLPCRARSGSPTASGSARCGRTSRPARSPGRASGRWARSSSGSESMRNTWSSATPIAGGRWRARTSGAGPGRPDL